MRDLIQHGGKHLKCNELPIICSHLACLAIRLGGVSAIDSQNVKHRRALRQSNLSPFTNKETEAQRGKATFTVSILSY